MKQDIQALTSFHNNRLNNIQSTITRLSNIGYTLISIDLIISGIFVPLLFSLNIVWYGRICISVIKIIITLSMFYCFAINLNNERVFVNVYNKLLSLNLNELCKTDNPWETISNINYLSIKKEIGKSNRFKKYKSWVSILWGVIIVMDITVLIITILMIFNK